MNGAVVAIDVEIAELHARLGDVLNRVRYGGQHLRILRHGRPVADLVPVRDAAKANVAPSIRVRRKGKPS